MSKKEELMKEVSSNLTQINDYLKSVGPDGLVDHLSAIEVNVRLVETLKLLVEYATTLEQLL